MQYRFLYNLVTLLLLGTAGRLQAQHSSATELDKFSLYRRYTMEQGLSNNWVQSIAQDEDGFMWFGTEDGLNRFDGEHFTTFYYHPDGNGLLFNTVDALLALPGRRLLIGGAKGLCVLNTRSLEFTPVWIPVRDEFKDFDKSILTIFQDSARRIWVGTSSGIFLLDEHLAVIGSIYSPSDAKSPFQYFAREFIELPNGMICFRPSVNNIMRPWQVIDIPNRRTEPLINFFPACGVLDTAKVIHSLICDGKSALWYGAIGTYSDYSLFRFDWVAQRTEPKLVHQGDTRTVGHYFKPMMMSDSLLFLESAFGKSCLYNLRNGDLTEIPYWNTSYPDGTAACTFIDRDGNFWACPRFEGIYFFPLKPAPARPFTQLMDAHEKYMGTIYAKEWFAFINLKHQGQWWMGSPNGGLYAYDPKKETIEFVKDPHNLGMTYAYAFAPYRGDTLLALTNGGIYWLNSNNYRFGRFTKTGMDTVSTFLLRDKRGMIWSRIIRNGVTAFDPYSRVFQHFTSQGPNPPFPLPSATSVTEDENGDVWFAYIREGQYLVRWNHETGIFQKIEPLNHTGLSFGGTQGIVSDRHGNIWIATGNAFFRYELKSNELFVFGKDNGLNTNKVEGWAFDKKNNMWLATPYGLSRYNPQTGQIRTFYQSDGLLSNTISNVDLVDTAGSLLIVSTNKGVCIFDPNKIPATHHPPSMCLSGLWVSGNAVALPETGICKLPYNRNDIRIEYTGINFIDGDKNRYQYRLDAADDDWLDVGASKSATYLNLSPGSYTFRVRAANSEGIWSEEEARLSIIVYPPFWQTWAFRLTLLLALTGLGVWLYKRQIRLVEARQAEKARMRQQMSDLEMKALRAQMNPHFVFNALNSVQNFILKNDTREASRYLTKFARLMRLILENSESPVVPLAKEIELLRHYTELEALRFSNKFSFDFQIDKALNPESVSIPGMLIQPHIENAIWHGIMHQPGAGHLSVRFLKTANDTVTCEIEDNGVGRARAAEIERERAKTHRSTGLVNIQHRLELLKTQLDKDINLHIQDLYDEHGRSKGTKVVVVMPMLVFN